MYRDGPEGSPSDTVRSFDKQWRTGRSELESRYGPGGPRGFGQTPARLGESHPLCQLAATSLDRFTTRSYTDRGLMSRHLLAVVSLLSLALLTLACNGSGGPAASVSPTGEESPTVQPSETPTTATPSPTVSPQTTPSGTVSPTPTASPTSGSLTPASSPISAVAPADLTQYEGQTVNWEDCQFDPRTALARCPGRGTYAPIPPLTGQDITCMIAIIQGKPVIILCSSQEPSQTEFYTIQ